MGAASYMDCRGAGDVSLKYRQLSANKIYVLYENGGKTLEKILKKCLTFFYLGGIISLFVWESPANTAMMQEIAS